VVLINTNPLFANLIAHFVVPEDRLSPQRALGLGIAFCGVCGVFLGRPDPGLAPNPLLGNLLIALSGAMVAGRTVYIQRLVQQMDPAKALFWQMAASTPLFAVGAWALGDSTVREPLSWKPVAAVGYQGVFVSGLALILWVHLLKRHTPGGVSVFSFATPIAGLLLSAWMFDEALTPRLMLGLAAVLTGVALAAGSGPAQRPGAAA
jgi:drug/metabolite transporter (DMT)-like permease